MKTKTVIELQCTEIWGGFNATDSAVSVPGINAFILSQPYQQHPAGGDIHYVSLCGHGALSRFVVADVAGHGRSVAHLSDLLRSLMRQHMNTPDQSQFAQSLNHHFAALADQGRFATALLTSYYSPIRQLITCNAGHPPPLWYHSPTGSWRLLEYDTDYANHQTTPLPPTVNLPLGLIEQTDYHQFAVSLAPGDVVLIYTDSLIEARDPAGQPLGQQGLVDLADRLDPAQPHQIGSALLQAVADYRHQQPPEDDVTLLTLHHSALGPTTPPD